MVINSRHDPKIKQKFSKGLCFRKEKKSNSETENGDYPGNRNGAWGRGGSQAASVKQSSSSECSGKGLTGSFWTSFRKDAL